MPAWPMHWYWSAVNRHRRGASATPACPPLIWLSFILRPSEASIAQERNYYRSYAATQRSLIVWPVHGPNLQQLGNVEGPHRRRCIGLDGGEALLKHLDAEGAGRGEDLGAGCHG